MGIALSGHTSIWPENVILLEDLWHSHQENKIGWYIGPFVRLCPFRLDELIPWGRQCRHRPNFKIQISSITGYGDLKRASSKRVGGTNSVLDKKAVTFEWRNQQHEATHSISLCTVWIYYSSNPWRNTLATISGIQSNDRSNGPQRATVKLRNRKRGTENDHQEKNGRGEI